MDWKALRPAIAVKIEAYLAGRIGSDELILWAWEQDVEEYVSHPQGIDYWLVQDGIWAIRMMTESEPEEYRTTREELELTLRYLTGEVPFPPERIPAQNLEDLRLETAAVIEDYLANRLSSGDLIAWGKSHEHLLDDLQLPETTDARLIRHAMEVIRKLEVLPPDSHGSVTRELRFAVRYLKGTITFPG